MRIVEVTKRPKYNRNGSGKIRVFIFPKSETVLEHFFEGRHTRPYNEYRKLLPEILELAEINVWAGAARPKWSQRAGCQCSCSPGFIIDKYGPKDVFVTVDMSEEQVAV